MSCPFFISVITFASIASLFGIEAPTVSSIELYVSKSSLLRHFILTQINRFIQDHSVVQICNSDKIIISNSINSINYVSAEIET